MAPTTAPAKKIRALISTPSAPAHLDLRRVVELQRRLRLHRFHLPQAFEIRFIPVDVAQGFERIELLKTAGWAPRRRLP
jgi:hypothetical protein